MSAVADSVLSYSFGYLLGNLLRGEGVDPGGECWHKVDSFSFRLIGKKNHIKATGLC